MRKLSMKGKRGKSETSSDRGSDGDSEENGAGVKTPADDDAPHEEETPKPEKKTKKGRRSKADPDPQTETNKDAEPTEETTTERENGTPAKKRKKEGTKASTSEAKPVEQEEEYEVLKIVDQRTIKGRRQFLVRWKGYEEDADTWEQEKNLNCPQLIEEYLSEIVESSLPDKATPKTPRTPKEAAKKTPKSASKKKAAVVAEDAEGNEDKDEIKEFEVEKIVEVHFQKKTNKREFLIRWKGFSSAEDTWEPEENLNCPQLIAKFMDKVDNAKKTEPPELRTNPAHTKRYTLMSTESGRRLSRRNKGKQRAMYHQCDE